MQGIVFNRESRVFFCQKEVSCCAVLLLVAVYVLVHTVGIYLIDCMLLHAEYRIKLEFWIT